VLERVLAARFLVVRLPVERRGAGVGKGGGDVV
jgi:hypothetical protein